MGVTTEAGSSVARLAREYLDAVTGGDAAAAERYFHADIIYIVNGPPRLPMRSTCRSSSF